MKSPHLTLLLPILGLGILTAAPVRADLNSDLAFSAFSNVDVNALAGGAVLQARGGLLTFPRGITSQSLYIIDALPPDVAHKLTHWDPASHPVLKVWLHKSGLPAHPTAADFSVLGTLPDNSSVQFQIDSTAKLDPANPSLQVSKEEAQLIATTAAQEKDPKALFVKVWSQILAGRINDFLAGRGASDNDIASGGDVRPLSDVKSLFHSDIKVYGQYQRLLNQTPVKALAGASAAGIAPADIYCECFDVEGSAALGTGAVYQAASGTSIQSADIEFYTNSGVYATVELEQMWPITVNGKTETLVWRDDLVSAPNIAYLHGTERLASGMIMLQETKDGVEAFRSEFK
ncbi:MAG TPA: hypothetical protein VGZ93_07910 [Candidatus Methylacidiphilales bacterium]|jgi:hypothetical protein|nr:hypothetical protein [Candidatus Methylacidiphilales bacterium]